jgi:DNA-binding beta-propeller fold protein YncE
MHHTACSSLGRPLHTSLLAASLLLLLPPLAGCPEAVSSLGEATNGEGSYVAPVGGSGGAPLAAGGTGGSMVDPTAGGAGASGAGPSPDGEPGQPDSATDGGTGPSPDGMRDVLLVGNSVAGTISFVDAHSHANLGSVNVIPDFDEVMLLINLDLVRFFAYPIVKRAQLLHHFEPADGDRFVDDIFVSPDGNTLYVSRSNLGDVAAFDLTKPDHPRLWRTFVSSPKADHATLSPDGKVIVVSATGTARIANVIDTTTGAIVGEFATGAYPHQNDYSHDGKFIFNSSIGNVSYGSVTHANNSMKGDRWLVKVDATTLEVVRTWVFDYGIRPNVFTKDDKTLYTQLSYLNGVIKYDLEAGAELARNEQPLSKFALDTYATYDEYPHDSAHHGLAINSDGTRLCDCGTIDNTVAIIDTATMQTLSMTDVGMVPYWATTSPDGKYCFVSMSGDDTIAVIDYADGKQVKVLPVGKFPQRSRLGRVPEAVIAGLDPEAG